MCTSFTNDALDLSDSVALEWTVNSTWENCGNFKSGDKHTEEVELFEDYSPQYMVTMWWPHGVF